MNHYAVFWNRESDGANVWARLTNKREALKLARRVHGTVGSLSFGLNMAWDAPTFRVQMNPVADFRKENA